MSWQVSVAVLLDNFVRASMDMESEYEISSYLERKKTGPVWPYTFPFTSCFYRTSSFMFYRFLPALHGDESLCTGTGKKPTGSRADQALPRVHRRRRSHVNAEPVFSGH